jgi:hypothetical protein
LVAEVPADIATDDDVAVEEIRTAAKAVAG